MPSLNEPLPEEPNPTDLPPELNLPVDHLFSVDPLRLTSSDLSLIANHYRSKRLNFLKAETTKPKTVERSRNPKLDATATAKRVDDILAGLIGTPPAKKDP